MMCSTPSVPQKRRPHIIANEQELNPSDDDRYVIPWQNDLTREFLTEGNPVKVYISYT